MAAKAKKPLESAVKKKIKEAFDDLSPLALAVMPVGNQFTGRGAPDFVCSVYGVSLWVEVKRSKSEQPKVIQADWLRAAENTGALAVLVDMDNVEAFVMAINAPRDNAVTKLDEARALIFSMLSREPSLFRWRDKQLQVIEGV